MKPNKQEEEKVTPAEAIEFFALVIARLGIVWLAYYIFVKVIQLANDCPF